MDDLEQAVGDLLLAMGVRCRQRSIEVQRGQAMNRCPCGLVESVTAVRREDPGGDEVVDAAAENPERMAFGRHPRVGVVQSPGANAVRNRPGSARAKSTYAWPVARKRARARRSRGPRFGTAANDATIASPSNVIP